MAPDPGPERRSHRPSVDLELRRQPALSWSGLDQRTLETLRALGYVD